MSSPVTPFTETAFNWMIQSEELWPSIYETVEDPSIDKCYEKRVLRKDLHLPESLMRGVAKAIYMIGVNLLVAPAGVLYHIVQMLRRTFHIIYSDYPRNGSSK